MEYQSLTDKFEILPLLNMTEEEFGIKRARKAGKKRITDRIIECYSRPDYTWAIRTLLENRKFDTLQELYNEFQKYQTIATTKDAKDDLRLGLSIALNEKIDNCYTKAIRLENDKDYIAIKGINININNIDILIDYFNSK